jgi:transcriptional regulator with XRE-family HTH domain
MGIEEAILKEVEEKGIEQGITLKNIKGVQNLLKQGKLNIQEIAEVLEVSINFVMKIQNGEIKNP